MPDTPIKTCRSCQLPKPIGSFTLNQNGTRSPRCNSCRAGCQQKAIARDLDPKLRKANYLKVARWMKAKNLETQETAVKARSHWTETEETVLLDPTISHIDAAGQLGRSFVAVIRRRQFLKNRLGLPTSIRAAAAHKRKYFPPALPASERNH